MNVIWLFRTNIKSLEYYHEIKDLKTFKEKCHDFYLLMLIYYLEVGYFKEAVVWRLSKTDIPEIVFKLDNGSIFIQRWVRRFSEVFLYKKPYISFFRGGFPEYDEITKINKKFFGKKLYLGAGQRIYPRYGGKYDLILIEDERDLSKKYNCIPFFKTANDKIFFPLKNVKKEYDICWPSNFSQHTYKGQELFMRLISFSDFLKSLKIIHLGNEPKRGEKIAEKYGIKNIEFVGWVDKPTLNIYLNKSKFGLNVSNLKDGCPRVSTEILMSGIPLLLLDTVRCLKFYRKKEFVINFNEKNIVEIFHKSFSEYNEKFKDKNIGGISISNISEMNYKLWSK